MKHNAKALRGSSRTTLALALVTALTGCQSFGRQQPAPTVPAAQAPAPAPVQALEPIDLTGFAYREPVIEGDLLERLRSQFALAGASNAAVARERDWYIRNQALLTRAFGRAQSYLFHIVAALEQRGMPPELALLPVLESAYDPFATSPGGAAGLWQIVPDTGRRLGLRQSWWYDGRRDVIDSTQAALDYLQGLHQKFNGDWLLAVAGYNFGEGNLERALRRAKADGRALTFWKVQDYLPGETRTFVARLLALSTLVAAPESYGIELPQIRNTARFAAVDTSTQIDMSLAADLAGIETDRLYELNPGVSRWATDPSGPHRLLVPIEQMSRFSSALAALGDQERVRWTRHRVKQGETIAAVAEQHRTTATVLREVNHLRGNTLRVGVELLIPSPMGPLSASARNADLRDLRRESVAMGDEQRTHMVAPGDTLWSIARRYAVDVRSLAAWNAMAPGDVLRVGRKLIVGSGGTVAKAVPDPATPQIIERPPAEVSRADDAASSAPATANSRQITYVVRRGDSLSSIARRFRVTIPKLMEWNMGAGNNYLQPGQRLVVFVDVTEQSG